MKLSPLDSNLAATLKDVNDLCKLIRNKEFMAEQQIFETQINEENKDFDEVSDEDDSKDDEISEQEQKPEPENEVEEELIEPI